MALTCSTGCSRTESSTVPAVDEVEVSVVTPQQRQLPRFVRVTGTLYGEEETTIAAKVAGRVAEVLADLGDAVAPGEPVLRIDPTDYELARTERERAFAETLAQLGLSELPPAQDEKFDLDAVPSVERARLQAENDRAKFERGKSLMANDPPLISEQDYENLRTSWEVAQSNLKVERFAAQARLAEARTLQAQVEIAQQRVRDTVHRAPQAGTADMSSSYEVAARLVSVGDYVQVGAPLARLVDADPLKLRALVPERRQGTIKPDQRAIVRVEDVGRAVESRVSRVSPSVETATRSFPVEILVPNADRALKPGSFATAEIEIGQEQGLMVPASAIVTFAGVNKILLVQDGKIRDQRVDIGLRSGDLVEIRSELAPDAQIVARPAATLTAGTAVRIVGSSEGSSAKAGAAGSGASP